jgi:glycosyltransferase 2 family protein
LANIYRCRKQIKPIQNKIAKTLKKNALIQTLVFALMGVFLLYLSFRKTDFSEILLVISQGDFWVMIPVLFVSIGVYISRVKRWQLLFETIKIKAPANYLLASLATGYLVNFAVPRLGEISRAIVLKKSLDYPVNDSLSTIVFERLADMLCLLIIILWAFGTEFIKDGELLNYFTKDMELFTPKKGLILFLVLSAALVAYQLLKNRKDQVSTWLNKLVQNVFLMLKMPNAKGFILHTLAIWVGFFLMTYLWFFMFKESSQLSLYDAFLIMVLGVVARSLPIQAGSAGAYHYVVSQALLLMGVNLITGNALALVIHGFQTILTLLFGFSAYLWLLYQNKKHVS